MLCCLNPDCQNPLNSDVNKYCQSCNASLSPLLRGHYRVTGVLSDEGGFGKTYLAEDIDKLNERCVVKQLAPKAPGTWALNKAIELFKQEAQRLQELGKHPQIPTLLAYFEQDNYLYLVQEFIDGQNLLKELQVRGRFNETEIQEVLLDLLRILKFIHDRGVIHRDIKPQNIVRRQSDGKLVLIDFGASKQLTATVQTKPGTAIGSFGYSPIEQIQGGETCPASDFFSLGATCFHLLTDVPPFQLWTQQGYAWVNHWRHYLRKPISRQYTYIFDKLLKKDIPDRYQSAQEVITDLTSTPPPKASVSASLPISTKPAKRSKSSLLAGSLFMFTIGVTLLTYLLSLGWLPSKKFFEFSTVPLLFELDSGSEITSNHEIVLTKTKIPLNEVTTTPKSVLQVIDKQPISLQDYWLHLRVCSIVPKQSKPQSSFITTQPKLKLGEEAWIQFSKLKTFNPSISESNGSNQCGR